MEKKEQLEQLGFQLNFMVENEMYESASIVAAELSKQLSEEAAAQRKAQNDAINHANTLYPNEIPNEIPDEIRNLLLSGMGLPRGAQGTHIIMLTPEEPIS